MSAPMLLCPLEFSGIEHGLDTVLMAELVSYVQDVVAVGVWTPALAKAADSDH